MKFVTDWAVCGSNSGWDKGLYTTLKILHGSGANPPSYAMGIEVLFPRELSYRIMMLTTDFHQAPSLGMSGITVKPA